MQNVHRANLAKLTVSVLALLDTTPDQQLHCNFCRVVPLNDEAFKVRAHMRIPSAGKGCASTAQSYSNEKLGRFVALKFLPDEVAKDSQALSRFQNLGRGTAYRPS
jgi:hypothetical protein